MPRRLATGFGGFFIVPSRVVHRVIRLSGFKPYSKSVQQQATHASKSVYSTSLAKRATPVVPEQQRDMST